MAETMIGGDRRLGGLRDRGAGRRTLAGDGDALGAALGRDSFTGRLGGVKMAFLPRHGRGHVHSPTTVPLPRQCRRPEADRGDGT